MCSKLGYGKSMNKKSLKINFSPPDSPASRATFSMEIWDDEKSNFPNTGEDIYFAVELELLC